MDNPFYRKNATEWVTILVLLDYVLQFMELNEIYNIKDVTILVLLDYVLQ